MATGNPYGLQTAQTFISTAIPASTVQRIQSSLSDQSVPKGDEYFLLSARVAALSDKCAHLEKQLKQTRNALPGFIKINMISGKSLRTPLDVIVETDEPGFIARVIDLPLYGHGDDVYDAIKMLKAEIESLYRDLMEDDDFTDEWLAIKRFLQENLQD
jgi:hypothetical protein